MTQAEFAKGWKLLVLQPWGWRYRSLTEQGQLTEETKTQMEFYYDKLKWAHGEAWWKVAEMCAQANKWPSVNDLLGSLQHLNSRYVTALSKPESNCEPMPQEVREILNRMTAATIVRFGDTDH